MVAMLSCSQQESSTSGSDSTEQPVTESGSSGSSVSLENISGKWLVLSAKRDFAPTSTLKDAYFIFGPGNALKVNLDGTERSGTARINGDSLYQEVPELPVTYTASMSGDRIVLEGLIQSMVFQFELGRDTSTAVPPQ